MLTPQLIADVLNAHVREESIEQILRVAKPMEIKNQALLVKPGEVCDKVFFILDGAFVCRYIDEELDIAKTINFYMEDLHPFMSCVDSFFSGAKTQCELRAIRKSSIVEIKKKDIEALTQTDINLFHFYHNLIITALTEENDFKLKIIAYTSEQLYQYLLQHFPVIIQRVPSRYIAEFMGISAEWLSKLKHKY